MNVEQYLEIRERVIDLGYADEIEWSENCRPPETTIAFALEAAFVVCNSGMKATIARPIFDRVRDALLNDRNVCEVFGHAGKASAIQDIWQRRGALFAAYMDAEDKIAFCETLPWIGPITKYHLAKNFGVDCAKPDRHLQRVADNARKSVDELCRELSASTGDKIRTVDLVIWRAAERGILS